tara:strand:+ start:2720 stop:5845 length:3126 start_codon:yes stop_codon:yes gene_type:complete
MAEKTFRSPGVFEQEVDLTQRVQDPLGTPAGIIGTAERGPAFVPITVGSMADFETKFGNLDSKKFGPYAVEAFLNHAGAATYVRVLGGGANSTSADIATTEDQGSVKNAGFKLAPDTTDGRQVKGAVQFIAARHSVPAAEAQSPRIFTDNDSFPGGGASGFVNLIRGVVFTTNDTAVGVLDGAELGDQISAISNVAAVSTSGIMDGKFKIYVSSSADSFGTVDGQSGVRIFTASLDPRNKNYIRNILNTNPSKFEEEGHLLYAAYDVEASLAAVATSGDAVAMLSGSSKTSTNNPAGDALLSAYGRFDTRYTTPKTTEIISQPFGEKEFDLFHIESLDDGAFSNNQYKVSLANIKGSTDPLNPYGTFTVYVRGYNDSDSSPEIIEQFPNCSLNPDSESFVGAMIGDRRFKYNLDATDESERKLVSLGSYSNKSNLIRVVLSDELQNGDVPKQAIPFGFKGMPVLKTNDALTDTPTTAQDPRLYCLGLVGGATAQISGSIVPPVPYVYKVTKGAVATTAAYAGEPGALEDEDPRIYWGVKTTLLAPDTTINPNATGATGNAILKSNLNGGVNQGLKDMLKFSGISKMDNLVTGSGADDLNNNKFTLARVALSAQAGGTATGFYSDTEITGAAGPYMREAAYLRDAKLDNVSYVATDGTKSNRITFATLAAQTSSVTFNKFTDYMKFTTVLHGGFDGLNILDRNAARMNDKSVSVDSGGGAATSFTSPGLSSNVAGTGLDNNGVSSYRTAALSMLDPFTTNINILAIPGIREPFVTDFVLEKNTDYGMALYLMDIPAYDKSNNRLYADSTNRPEVQATVAKFEARGVDNNSAASYFPDVSIGDATNNKVVDVPSSVAAIGALGYTDKARYPWFAPAGFDRGSLSNVESSKVKLNAADKDSLYDARINPIATFPRIGPGGTPGYVIFGQKTLQQAKSALDRVNVRRMLLEVKRQIVSVANTFVFEQNTPALRKKFVAQVSPLLAAVQAQSGIEKFRVIMDDTNNSQADIQSNKLNGRIILVPTRAIEFISLDFIITNAGVSFEV